MSASTGVLKSERNWVGLTDTQKYPVLTKYTKTFNEVIKIDNKVHVIGNRGIQTWSEWGLDTCYPWHVNMMCPFNQYNGAGKKVLLYVMPK